MVSLPVPKPRRMPYGISVHQCDICGRRFGKKSGLARHKDVKIVLCTRPEGGVVSIHPGLVQAAENIRGAKGYAELMSVGDECRLYCDMNAIREREHGAKKNTQKRVTQDSDGPEPFSQPSVVLQPLGQPYVNGDMTNALTVGGDEFGLGQQGGLQGLARDTFRQDSPTVPSECGSDAFSGSEGLYPGSSIVREGNTDDTGDQHFHLEELHGPRIFSEDEQQRGRQRLVTKRRSQQTFLCVFLGVCPFMPGKHGFHTCSKAKEDALRHINVYQCDVCGKRFGKKSGLARHQGKDEKKVPCTRPECGVVSVHPGLGRAAENLRGAKGYTELMSASDECRLYCDMGAIREREHGAKKNTQKRVTQGSDGPEPFSPPLVVLQPLCQPYANDDMTSALTVTGDEFGLGQQGGSQVLGRDTFRQGSLSANVTRRDYRNDAYGCYPDTADHPLPS